jgi:hypothetical protein
MAWKNHLCEIKGKLSSVLVDQRFENEFPLKELPNVFWVAVYCNLPSNDSFWHPDETLALDDIENNLLKLAESFGNGWIVYVIRIDTVGVREYYFYYGKHADVDKVTTLLKSLHPSYQIESETKEDAKWTEYKNHVSFENNGNTKYIN